MEIQFGMKDGILRGVAGMEVLHEGGKVPVHRAESDHVDPLHGLRGEDTPIDEVGDMVTDLPIGQIHLKLALEHLVVGPGDELGYRETQLLVTDTEGVVEEHLAVIPLVRDSELDPVVCVMTAD